MSVRYRLLDHTTDAEIESYGATLEEAFENAAFALEDTMVDVASIRPEIEEQIMIKAKDKEALLYSWLEALIIRQDTENMLFSKFSCKISDINKGFQLKAKISGEKFDPTRHEQKTAIKAPTYHGMKIVEGHQRTTLRFLLDL
ncbi:MAG: archease [Nitrososphaerales archaeon]